MSTLMDVSQKIGEIEYTKNLFGCTAKFAKEFLERTLELGSALCKEQGIEPAQGEALPMETVLGPESEKLFLSLQLWYKEIISPTQTPPK